jgi:polyhydroxyalkanoate synthesis regulator phasin
MTTKKAKLVHAESATVVAEHHVEHHAKGPDFAVPDIPASVFVDLARMGVQMGIGLAALAYDETHRVLLDAIDRGAKIEKKGLKKLSTFEHEQVTHMKDYLRRVKATAEKSTNGASIEAHVEEALKTHDVPTRDDIRELQHQIHLLSEKVSKLHAHK